ncbi:integral membrane protein [Aspergillus sclerotialis]|uniref:Integral membrane protein n=1 Tax=Aspergillus sclerotialis TaxID=2070753 RepID=A0A3A2ZED0_9EURO|nr:integral membrane protein [Aspergillus sclerotialis]
MPGFKDFMYTVLRLGEVASGAVVAGTIGQYLSEYYRTFGEAQAIYTEVVAAISILTGLIGPFAGSITWPLDIILCLAWFASFGALFRALADFNCDGSYVDNFGGPITNCARWKAGESFAFISGFLWLVTSVLGVISWTQQRTKQRQGGKSAA